MGKIKLNYRKVFILLSFTVSIIYGVDKPEYYTVGTSFEVSFTSLNSTKILRPNAYINLYELPINPFELELQLFTAPFVRSSKETKFAYSNLMLQSIAWMCLLYGNDDRFWGYGLIGSIVQLPVTLGNFKIHLPIITDGVHLCIGQNTDYYFIWDHTAIYTESNAGIKMFIGPVTINAAINKPWLKSPISNGGMQYTLGIGIYTSRKKMKKNMNKGWPATLSNNIQ